MASPNLIPALKKQALQDLNDIIETYSGKMPTDFSANGVHYDSPQAYASKILPDPKDNSSKILYLKWPEIPKTLVDAAGAKGADHIVDDVFTAMPSSVVELPAIEAAIIDQLKKGHSVPVSLEWVHEFIDKKPESFRWELFIHQKIFYPPHDPTE